jgi:ATP adenylyltransferase
LREDATCPHNVILWDSWLVVVPRRKSAVGKASANSAGMLGSVWVAEPSLVEEWKRLGCKHVLGELGIPWEEDS